MKNFIKSIILGTALIISLPALSENVTNDLATCLVDALDGKERKQLAKWIFFSIAAHPEIKPYSNITAKNINESDKYIGKLITRLLTSDCPDKLKKAQKVNPSAIKKSFELVGKVAMQELMTNQNVRKSLTNYVQYTDLEKIKKLFLEK